MQWCLTYIKSPWLLRYLKKFYKTKLAYSALVLGNSKSVLFPQQLYIIVTAQLISSSFICDIFSNISATKAI